MGTSIRYESLTGLSPRQEETVRTATHAAISGYSWLSCEPVSFHQGSHLAGSSKLANQIHPDDAAAAATENLPDGNLMTVIDILCDLSRRFGIEWELSHDYSAGPFGTIVDGECDPDVLMQCAVLPELTDGLLSGDFDAVDLDDDGPQPGMWQEPEDD